MRNDYEWEEFRNEQSTRLANEQFRSTPAVFWPISGPHPSDASCPRLLIGGKDNATTIFVLFRVYIPKSWGTLMITYSPGINGRYLREECMM